MNNDLISRSELKKAFEHLASDDYESQLWYESTVFRVIDNAPTVEPEKAKEGELVKAYTKGFDAGVETARPQGEWIIDNDNLPVCKECGEIALQRVFVKVPHLIQDVRMVKSNFCPNCGADMRKGGSE